MKKSIRSSMMSGKTHIRLDLAKKTSRKTLRCALSTSEVCTGCERSSIWISESIIEDIENTKCVSDSSKMEAPLITYSSLIASKEDESVSSTSRNTEKYGSSIFSS